MALLKQITVCTPIGDGKTHYVNKQLYGLQPKLRIAVNESFTPLNAILKLRSLPRDTSCKIFFNFTLVVSIHQCLFVFAYTQIALYFIWFWPSVCMSPHVNFKAINLFTVQDQRFVCLYFMCMHICMLRLISWWLKQLCMLKQKIYIMYIRYTPLEIAQLKSILKYNMHQIVMS